MQKLWKYQLRKTDVRKGALAEILASITSVCTRKTPTVTAEFYRDVMGMQIVGGSSADAPIGASAFLSSRPEYQRNLCSKATG